MSRILKVFLIVLQLLFMTACGGGGGSDSTTAEATYSVSGTVSAASGSAVDSDVNDINTTPQSNNSFGSAQNIPNPVTLGGYVNVAGEGAEGLSKKGGDTDDYFEVTLLQDQVITLLIANHPTGKLDLYLYDSSEALVESSEGTTQTESITVPSDGTFYIRVKVTEGFSNYVLSIGQSSGSAGDGAGLDPDADFVPGEVIVRFKDDADTGWRTPADTKAASLGFIRKAGAPGRAELLGLGAGAGRQRVFDTLGISRMSGQLPGEDEESALKRETIEVIKALRKRDDVLYADPNYIRRAFTVPDDTHYSLQWHYPLINLPQAWELTTGDSGVIVAVIDTGVLLDHPDLSGQLVGGYDFISDPDNANDGDGIDDDPDDPGDDNYGGSSFHGTHVAGTVAAATNNAKGVAGAGWNVNVMPVRVLGTEGGTSHDLIQSIRYAAGLENDSDTFPAQAADIINMSLGGSSSSDSEQAVITRAREAGVIVIAAAGNNDSSSPSYPAAYDNVVSVSAVDIQKERASYSNYGSTVDVAAPGGDLGDKNGDGYFDGVLSTVGDDSSGPIQYVYAFYQGTSMAAPHVAGVAALMKSVNSDLSPDLFDSFLAGNDNNGGVITEDLGDAGRDDLFGYGLIDAYKAVNEALSVTPDTPLLVVSPSSLNFGTSDTTSTVSASNGGGGDLTLSADDVTDNADWLTVEASSDVDANGLGTYTVTVDRDGLADATYNATITFTSSENEVTVPVIMQVSTDSITADAGYQYILLLDPDTYETKYQFSRGAQSGSYEYLLSSVGSGDYIIISGSDLDNDLSVCETGEACGAYTTLNDPLTVTVGSDRSGLDFSSGFELSFDEAVNLNASGMRVIRPGRKIERIW